MFNGSKQLLGFVRKRIEKSEEFDFKAGIISWGKTKVKASLGEFLLFEGKASLSTDDLPHVNHVSAKNAKMPKH